MAKSKSQKQDKPRKANDVVFVEFDKRKLTKAQLKTQVWLESSASPFNRYAIGDLSLDQLRWLVYEAERERRMYERGLNKIADLTRELTY